MEKNGNNPLRTFEIANKIGSAAATRNPKAALAATPKLIKFAKTGEGIKVVQKARRYKSNTKKLKLEKN